MSFLKPFVNILFLGKKKKKGEGGLKKVGGKSCCNPSTGHTMCWRLAYKLRLYTAMELWLYWCNIINHTKLHWEGGARLGYVTQSEFKARPVKRLPRHQDFFRRSNTTALSWDCLIRQNVYYTAIMALRALRLMYSIHSAFWEILSFCEY
jgi:hypothetical protein